MKAESTGRAWEDRVFDLRLEDDETPLTELRRVVGLARAYNRMNADDLAIEHGDHESAFREYGAAAKIAQTMPGVDRSLIAEMSFWHARGLVQMDRTDQPLPLFKKAFALHPQWVVIVPRMQKAGMLPNDRRIIEGIQEQASKGRQLASHAGVFSEALS